MKISANKNEDSIIITVSNIEKELVISSYSNSEMEYYSHREDKLDEIVDEFIMKNAGHPVLETIKK